MKFTSQVWSFNDFKKDTKHLFSDINKPPGFDEAVDKMQNFKGFVPIRMNMIQDKIRSVTSNSLAEYLNEYGYVDFDDREGRKWWSSSYKRPYFEDDDEKIKLKAYMRDRQLKLDYELAKELDEMIKVRTPGIDDDMTDILRI